MNNIPTNIPTILPSLENNWVEEEIQWKTGAELYSSAYEEAEKKSKERTQRAAEEALTELENNNSTIEIDIDTLKEIARLNPDNKEIAKVLTLMSTSGGAIYLSGAGAALAEAIAGISTYMYAVPSGSNIVWQYFGSIGARHIATSAINFTICGVSAATLSNVSAAVIGGYCVGKVGEAAYNRFIARNEEEKININFIDSAKHIIGKVWK